MADIQEAIKNASAAAAAIIDAEVTQETLPATQSGYEPAVVSYVKPSMATMGNSNTLLAKVDSFLKVNEFGLSLGDDRNKMPSIDVEMDLTEGKGFVVKQSIKWGKSPVQYANRYDGMLSDKGENWSEVVARAQRIEPGTPVFTSADFVVKTLAVIKQGSAAKPAKDLPAGSILGHSLSRSNWQNFEVFYHDAVAKGLEGQTVKVRLTAEEVNGKNNFTWGVIGFSLIE